MAKIQKSGDMVEVKNLIGKNCVTSKDGKTVAANLLHLVDTSLDLEFDFSGVEVFSTSFFKGFLNCIHRKKDIEKVLPRIKLIGISDLGDSIYNQVVDNFFDSLKSDFHSDNFQSYAEQEVHCL